MFRPSASPRYLAGLALAAAVGTGIGVGAATLGSSSATATSPALHGLTSTADAAAAPASPAAAAAGPLTVDQAKAVALQASPGTVVEAKQDNEAADPTEANDPTEAPEPTGLSYDVTVQAQDGTTTKVVVDGATGQVVSTEVNGEGNGD